MDSTVPSVFDEFEQNTNFEYATTGQRLANLLIDLIIVWIIAVVIQVIISIFSSSFRELVIDPEPDSSTKAITMLISTVLFIIAYSLIEWSTKGRSLGKLITKTVVIKEDGSQITFKEAFLRSVVRMVPFDTISGFSGYPWHDKWTKTYVVKKQVRI
jgi:uncharacterized RDD family membrane protein YckC